MERFKELLDRALAEPLTDGELDRLADLAIRARSVEAAVCRMILGGRPALMNLRRAAKLRHAYADSMGRHRLWSPRGRQWRIYVPSHRLVITSHALERYIERCGEGMSAEEAEARLVTEANMSFRIRRKSRNGHEQWRTPSGAVLVIKRDGAGRPATCVTVLTESQALSEERVA